MLYYNWGWKIRQSRVKQYKKKNIMDIGGFMDTERRLGVFRPWGERGMRNDC